MIQLYPKGQTDFSRNGIDLMPAENEVSWLNGGRYDFTMNIPREMAEKIAFDYGQILKVSVPPQIVGPISLGTVSYWTVNTNTPLYSQVPTWKTVKYDPWIAMKGYTAGAKVSYGSKNYQASHAVAPTDVAPSVNDAWAEIARSVSVPGKEITTLAAGTSVMKIKDFNSTYMEVATLTGYQGYIATANCTATGESEERIIPQFEITEQLFTINKIDKETDKHLIRIEAEHYSYMLGRTMLGECNVVGVNPATALLFIRGAMKEDYPGNLYCGVDEGTIDADWSWTNAQSAILDPQNGLLKVSGTQAVRDDLDVYIVPAAEETPAYEVAYGRNMKTVRWTGDVGNIITRVYPLAQREDGSRLTLPEEYIDTELTVPYCRPVKLDTKLKIGQKIQNSDGTEVELTESEVYTRMRQAAQDLFDIDHADQAEVTLALDFVHMPDTEEYKQYLNMRNMAPMEWVRVLNGPMGIETVIQMTGYTWDAIRLEYKSTKYGDKKQKATVSGYEIKSGAVSGRTLAQGAVGSEHIQAGAITAREIEAGSITAEQIASKVITAALIAAEAITADEIAAEAITTNKLAANAITAGKIAAGAINADHIAAAAISAINAKLGTATIEDGYINNAYINFGRLKSATAESLIARDAVTDKYYIDKLAVRSAQMVQATVGELVIKASDNKYYRLDVAANGSVSPTEVTLTSAEITAGITADGHGAIIETDLTAADLSATNMKAINALIDKLTAARIDVDELFARSAFIGKLNTTNIESTANLKIKAGGSFTVDSGNFSIDASGNVTMTGTVTAGANSVIGGWTLGANSLHSGSGAGYVEMNSNTSGTYAIWAGHGTAASAPFSVSRAGAVKATSGTIGGFTLSATRLSAGSGGNSVGLDSGTANFDYAMWAGNATAASAPFRLKRDGTLTLTKLMVLGENETETEVNLRNAGLWKLNYATVKSIGVSGNTLTIQTTAGTTTFSKAARAVLAGSWSGNIFTVSASNDPDVIAISEELTAATGTGTTTGSHSVTSFDTSHKAYARVTAQRASGVLFGFNIDASSEYEKGQKSVTASTGSWSNGSRTVSLSSPNTYTYAISVGNASGWTLSNTADKTAVASVTVAGKTFTNTFTYNWINHGDYNQGWNDCLAACGFENSSFYQGASTRYLYSAPMSPTGTGQNYNIAYGWHSVPDPK